MRSGSLTLERMFHTSVDIVWQALTDKEQMKEWYFDLNEFKCEIGFEFQFYGQGHKGNQYLHLCKITDIVTGRKLTYSWRYQGYEGISYVTFELFAEGHKTRLKLTHEGIETFPANDPDFARESFAEGWTYIVNTALTHFVEAPLEERSRSVTIHSPDTLWTRQFLNLIFDYTISLCSFIENLQFGLNSCPYSNLKINANRNRGRYRLQNECARKHFQTLSVKNTSSG